AINEVLEFGATASQSEQFREAERLRIVLVSRDGAVLVLAPNALPARVVVEVVDDRCFGGSADCDVHGLEEVCLVVNRTGDRGRIGRGAVGGRCTRDAVEGVEGARGG